MPSMRKIFRGKNPCPIKSGEFLDTEMPDTAVEPPNIEEEVNSPVKDDGRSTCL